MKFFSNVISAVVLVAATTSASPQLREESASCPPAGFDSIDDLDLQAFIANRWYSVKQMPVFYQRPNSFYCTYAEYSLSSAASKPWYCSIVSCEDNDSITVDVFNRALEDSVNGNEITANLKAIVPDPVNDASKLKVGQSFLPQFLYGDYWVVAIGKYSDLSQDTVNENDGTKDAKYDWAIISGGTPSVSSNDKCLPGKGRFNGNGLWMFSRLAVPPAGTIEAIDALAASKGFDTDAWKLVTQEGCDY